MKDKRSFGNQLEAFFEGKGFYIVLFLCAAVIGVSSWVLIMGTGVEEKTSDIKSAGVIVTSAPGKLQPEKTPTPTPKPVAETTEVVLPESENIVQVWNEGPSVPEDYFVWPVSGDVITPYAVNNLIYDITMEDWRAHGGIDISAPLGEHVTAVSKGVVTTVLSDAMYGTTIIISHADGLESIYSNLAGTPTVYEGDTVKAGQVIGGIGDTAICESALVNHLHFSMRKDGISADPLEYLP